MSGPASSLAGMTNAHEVVAAYWAAAEARDWTAFGALVADDVMYRGPQTREQVRGRDAYLRFNVEGFQYDWHITVQRIVAEDRHAASWIEFTGPEGAQPGLCFSSSETMAGSPGSPTSGPIRTSFRPAVLTWSNATSSSPGTGPGPGPRNAGRRPGPARRCRGTSRRSPDPAAAAAARSRSIAARAD